MPIDYERGPRVSERTPESAGRFESDKDEIRERARERTAEAKASAEDLAEMAREAPERVKEKTREGAERLAEEAKTRGREAIDEQRRALADRMDGIASALDAGARRLDEQDQRVLARYATRVADGLSDLAHSLKERDLPDLVHRLEGFARRQPGLFLGGAVAAGLALSRFAKASAARRHPEHTGDRPYREDFGRDYGGRTREETAVPYPGTSTYTGGSRPVPPGPGADRDIY